MIRLVLVATLLVGCRVSLETDDTVNRSCVDNTSQPCLDAVTHSDLAWIEQKIFAPSCSFTGCHNGPDDAGLLDLRAGKSHDALVGASSMLDPTRTLVMPNDVEASYLMLMLRDVPPEMANPPGVAPPTSVGYMPQGQGALCCQKLQAVERWIMAGAPN